MSNDISENVIYLCYYKMKSLRSNHAHDTKHIHFEVILFYNQLPLRAPGGSPFRVERLYAG